MLIEDRLLLWVLNSNFILHDVLLVPALPTSLLSVKKLCSSSNYQVVFNNNGCVFQEIKSQREVGRSWNDGMLYSLHVGQPISTKNAAISPSSHVFHWRVRLGLPSLSKLRLMVPSLGPISQLQCESCEMAKLASIFP